MDTQVLVLSGPGIFCTNDLITNDLMTKNDKHTSKT